MKVKALARLSTASGWKEPDEEFTVNAAEADALVERGLVVRSGAEPEQVADPAPPNAAKASKSKN